LLYPLPRFFFPVAFGAVRTDGLQHIEFVALPINEDEVRYH
jgi:hypothetical protein